MTDGIELLQQLGFGEYEARAYLSLLQHGALSGYALAKQSGIPRANIYNVLRKLEERGAAMPVSANSGTVYTPVPPDELIHRLGVRMNGVLDAAHRSLAQVTKPVEQNLVQNLQGYLPLLDHARDLINRAEEQLLVALWQPEAQLLADALATAEGRGVAVSTLCFQACPGECGFCRGDIYRYRVTPEDEAHWLVVIQDQKTMVIGTTEQPAEAIFTQQPTLIHVVTRYVRHSLALAAVLSDLGGNLEAGLQPETQALLQSIGQGHSWLEQMRHLLHD